MLCVANKIAGIRSGKSVFAVGKFDMGWTFITKQSIFYFQKMTDAIDVHWFQNINNGIKSLEVWSHWQQ